MGRKTHKVNEEKLRLYLASQQQVKQQINVNVKSDSKKN